MSAQPVHRILRQEACSLKAGRRSLALTIIWPPPRSVNRQALRVRRSSRSGGERDPLTAQHCAPEHPAGSDVRMICLSMLQACVVQRVTSAREWVFQLPDAVTASLGAIAAIPVRDEQDRIESCLDALLAQRDMSGRPFPPGALGLVLLLNNCSDRTEAIAVGVSPPAARPSPW
jgi:hypothetical protein